MRGVLQALEQAAVAREVVLEARLRVLQVVELLEQVDAPREREVVAVGHHLRAAEDVGVAQVAQVLVEDVQRAPREVHQLAQLLDLAAQHVEALLVALALLRGRLGVVGQAHRDRARPSAYVYSMCTKRWPSSSRPSTSAVAATSGPNCVWYPGASV